MNRENSTLIFHKDLGAEQYLLYNGKLVELVKWRGELHIPTGEYTTVVYAEHLDGPAYSKADAIALYPEEFV